MRRDPNALIAFLEAREGWAFGYGPEPRTHDCARFCAAGVEALTGVDPLGGFAGRWTSESGARRVIARHGGLAAAVDTLMSPVSPTLARRGDVGLTRAGGLVLVEGDRVVGPDPVRGLVRVGRSEMVRAWTLLTAPAPAADVVAP